MPFYDVQVKQEGGAWVKTEYCNLSRQGVAMDSARHVRAELRANGNTAQVRIIEWLDDDNYKIVATFNRAGALRWRC
jgi:hypothetical protein